MARTKCYNKYTLGTEYDFGTSTKGEGYWWKIDKVDGRFVVFMNGYRDKSFGTYHRACEYMDKVKLISQQ